VHPGVLEDPERNATSATDPATSRVTARRPRTTVTAVMVWATLPGNAPPCHPKGIPPHPGTRLAAMEAAWPAMALPILLCATIARSLATLHVTAQRVIECVMCAMNLDTSAETALMRTIVAEEGLAAPVIIALSLVILPGSVPKMTASVIFATGVDISAGIVLKIREMPLGPPVVLRCDAVGHIARNCPKCFSCGQFGHIARDCETAA